VSSDISLSSGMLYVSKSSSIPSTSPSLFIFASWEVIRFITLRDDSIGKYIATSIESLLKQKIDPGVPIYLRLATAHNEPIAVAMYSVTARSVCAVTRVGGYVSASLKYRPVQSASLVMPSEESAGGDTPHPG
jgi:hypothetical protein